MSIKKYLTLGIGIVTGIGVSIAGLSYASYNSSSSMRIITAQKAKDIMLGKVPGCTILEFSYDGDDRTPKYDGTVIKGNYEYEIDVDAKTGDIIKFEKEQILVSNGTSGGNSSNTINLITSKEAKDIMLKKVPGATIIEFSYDGDDAIPKYDGKLIKDNCEYEIDVNAKTGAIIKFEQENIHTNNPVSSNTNINNNQTTTKPSTSTSNSSLNNNQATTKPSTSTSNTQTTTNNTQVQQKPVQQAPVQQAPVQQQPVQQAPVQQAPVQQKPAQSSSSYIGEAKAKSIMLSRVPGGTFVSFKFDYDDGRPEYEGELVSGNMEYDITVDARTGAIIDFDSDSRYDD